MSAPRRLARPRVGAALLFFAVSTCGLVAAASRIAGDAAPLSMGLGVALTLLLFSLWEWATHRYVYHRALSPGLRPAFLTHHRDHHQRFFPAWRFTRTDIVDGSEQAHPSVWARILSRILHRPVQIPDRWVYFTFGVGIAAATLGPLTHNPAFVLGVAGASAVLARLFGSVHGAIHHPGTRPWLERRPVFALLRRHHYIHHVDTEANVNFLVPIADWAFGTLRLRLTDGEEQAERAGGASAA